MLGMTEKNIMDIIEKKKGIMLDIGCGEHKTQSFIGMDARKIDGVDIVHDLEVFPYPIPDESCSKILGSHVFEHINPQRTIPMLNELWRIMKWDGTLILTMPYAGSKGYWQDPTHCNGCTEVTFQYFDPKYPLHNIYKPLPWKIKKGYPTYRMSGNLEVVMDKVVDYDGTDENDDVEETICETPVTELGGNT